MIESPSFRHQLPDQEARLAPRRMFEHAARKKPAGSSSLLWYCHTVLKPILRFGLEATGLYGRGVRNALNVQARSHGLPFANLPETLDGFRLLQLSDLHIDGMDGLTERLCDLLSELPVDLCVLTGDYRYRAQGPCDGIYPRMRAILGAVRSRLGVVGILGNHDNADIAVELERQGVRMLLNESMQVSDGFWLTGADEIDEGAAFSEALNEVPAGAFHVSLVHTPQFHAQAAAGGSALYLCGHTHAGQVCLPGGKPLISNARGPRSHVHGFWNTGRMLGFTSSGAGCCMLPVRYNCPPEITLFDLRCC